MQFARAGDGLTIEAQNHIVFSQAGLFRRTVLHDFRHADAAHVAHAIATHVLFGHVLSVNAEKRAALKEESEFAIILPSRHVLEIEIEIEIEIFEVFEIPLSNFSFWRFWSCRRFGSFLSAYDTAND